MLKEYESYEIVNVSDIEFRRKFVERLPNDKELDKAIKIHNLIEDFSMKVYKERENKFLPKKIIGIDYIENLGYCMLIQNQSDYSVIKFSKDPIIAFKEIIINILIRIGIEYEKLNRDKLREDYQERFNDLEYNSNLYIVEYSLDKWLIYYDYKVPKDIISYYEDYLKRATNLEWIFDIDSYKFKIKSKILVK